jgi:hypothetical protein
LLVLILLMLLALLLGTRLKDANLPIPQAAD